MNEQQTTDEENVVALTKAIKKIHVDKKSIKEPKTRRKRKKRATEKRWPET